MPNLKFLILTELDSEERLKGLKVDSISKWKPSFSENFWSKPILKDTTGDLRH